MISFEQLIMKFYIIFLLFCRLTYFESISAKNVNHIGLFSKELSPNPCLPGSLIHLSLYDLLSTINANEACTNEARTVFERKFKKVYFLFDCQYMKPDGDAIENIGL